MEGAQQSDPPGHGEAGEVEVPAQGSAYGLRPRLKRRVALETNVGALAMELFPSPTPPMAAQGSPPQPLPPRPYPVAPASDAYGAPSPGLRSQAFAPSPMDESKVEGPPAPGRRSPTLLQPSTRPADRPRSRFMTLGSQFATIHGGTSVRSMSGRRVGVWQPAEAVGDAAGPSLDGSDDLNQTSGAPKGAFRFGQVLHSEEGEAFCYWVHFWGDPEGARCLVDFSEEVWVEVIENDYEDTDNGSMQRSAFLEPQNDLEKAAAPAAWLSPLRRRSPAPSVASARSATPQKRRADGASGATAPATGAATAPRTRTATGLVTSRGDGFTVIRTNLGPPGYEIYVDLPGVGLEDVSLRCHARGEVRVTVMRRGPGGDEALQRHETKTIPLPGRIDPKDAQALMTPAGQLYLRVASAGAAKP